MAITRRDFLKYCGVSAVALGLSSTDLLQMEELLANPGGPTRHLAARQQLHRMLHVLFKPYLDFGAHYRRKRAP